jgi:hypothetical protein
MAFDLSRGRNHDPLDDLFQNRTQLIGQVPIGNLTADDVSG